MKSVSGCEKRKQADLDHCVIEDLVLAGLVRVSILELSSDSAVAGCDCDASSEGSTGLQDDGASDESECAVDEGWI